MKPTYSVLLGDERMELPQLNEPSNIYLLAIPNYQTREANPDGEIPVFPTAGLPDKRTIPGHLLGDVNFGTRARLKDLPACDRV